MRGSGLPENLLRSANVYRLLNVRYFIVPAEMGAIEGQEPVSQTQMGGQPYESVYALPGLPRARLMADAVVVPDADAVATILDPGFDPEAQVVLAEEPPLSLTGGPVSGEVTWEERGVDRMRLRVSSDRDALLVLADNWFPSWHARVDGAEAPVLRAYHTLRAVPVAAGEHTVELYYRSTVVRWSLVLTLTVLAALLVAGGTAAWEARAGRREEGQPEGP